MGMFEHEKQTAQAQAAAQAANARANGDAPILPGLIPSAPGTEPRLQPRPGQEPPGEFPEIFEPPIGRLLANTRALDASLQRVEILAGMAVVLAIIILIELRRNG